MAKDNGVLGGRRNLERVRDGRKRVPDRMIGLFRVVESKEAVASSCRMVVSLGVLLDDLHDGWVERHEFLEARLEDGTDGFLSDVMDRVGIDTTLEEFLLNLVERKNVGHLVVTGKDETKSELGIVLLGVVEVVWDVRGRRGRNPSRFLFGRFTHPKKNKEGKKT